MLQRQTDNKENVPVGLDTFYRVAHRINLQCVARYPALLGLLT